MDDLANKLVDTPSDVCHKVIQEQSLFCWIGISPNERRNLSAGSAVILKRVTKK